MICRSNRPVIPQNISKKASTSIINENLTNRYLCAMMPIRDGLSGARRAYVAFPVVAYARPADAAEARARRARARLPGPAARRPRPRAVRRHRHVVRHHDGGPCGPRPPGPTLSTTGRLFISFDALGDEAAGYSAAGMGAGSLEPASFTAGGVTYRVEYLYNSYLQTRGLSPTRPPPACTSACPGGFRPSVGNDLSAAPRRRVAEVLGRLERTFGNQWFWQHTARRSLHVRYPLQAWPAGEPVIVRLTHKHTPHPARAAERPGGRLRRRQPAADLDPHVRRRLGHQSLRVPGQQRRRRHLGPLGRRPRQRRGHHRLHGRQPHQRHDLHHRGAGGERAGRRRGRTGHRDAARGVGPGRAGGADRRHRLRPGDAGVDRAAVPRRGRHRLPVPAERRRRQHLGARLDRRPGQRARTPSCTP